MIVSIKKMNNFKNGLYLVSTPIGNLEDIGLRAKKVLQKANIIICENPKHSLKLLNKLDIKKKLLPLHDYNEEVLIKKIEKYQKDSLFALISDAGSPLISDPGYKLVKNFINRNIFVTSVPGPSSIISSLQLSGLNVNSFVFFGFVPKNNNSAKTIAKKIIELNLTSIFFISGRRLKNFLELVHINSKNIEVAICKELTKINESVFRGNVKKMIDKITNKEINLKGEFTLIIGNSKRASKITIEDKIRKQTLKILKKYTLTETVEIVHKLSSISKKEIYKMALELKND
jgi:16S rRNA (cytidine1402-2'-O)-methyltransferase